MGPSRIAARQLATSCARARCDARRSRRRRCAGVESSADAGRAEFFRGSAASLSSWTIEPMLSARPITLLVAQLAGPCDGGAPPHGAGSGSGAAAQTASGGGASTHEQVVHALEKAIGAPRGPSTPPAKKPGKLKTPPRRTSGNGGGGRPSFDETKPEPKAEGTRRIGVACDEDDDCRSGWCDSDVCMLPYNVGLALGLMCTLEAVCASGYCTVDGECD